jgi:adenylate kinase
MANIIVMMGAPGAGKGTQARLLAEKFGYPQISTGDILREMARAETPLGREIRGLQAAGRLVSDEVLKEVIFERTSQLDCAPGYILDGYPRTLPQAQQLEELAEEEDKQIVLVRVMVPHEVLLKRLTGRRTCTRCGEIYNLHFRPPRQPGICDLDGAGLAQRADDHPEAVETRLKAYEESTAPLIDYYRQSGRLIELDGERPVAEVFGDLLGVIASSAAQKA